MGTSPEDQQEEPISPEALRKEPKDEAEPNEEKEETAEDEEVVEEALESLESFLNRLAAETPQDLAKALANTWSDEAASAVDFLLSQLLTPSPGVSSTKTAELLQSFVEELVSTDQRLKDLDLPSLPMVAEAASAGRLGTALPALRRALGPRVPVSLRDSGSCGLLSL